MVGLAVVLTSTFLSTHWVVCRGLAVSLMTLTRLGLRDPVLRTERKIFKLCSYEQEEWGGDCQQIGYKPKIKIIPTTDKLLGPPVQARGPCGYEGVTFSCRAVCVLQPSAAAHIRSYLSQSF